jgi:pimeloyl-ACP methyl ester carboxylesterase
VSTTTFPTETEQVERANASGLTPVVFIHGLWLLPSSWDRWSTVFDDAGYTALTPGWPDDPETVEEANANPEVFAHKTISQVADHYAEVIGKLQKRPAVIGHSFGGLLTQILAGRGLSAASVAIDPAPFRGVLPLPISALKSATPVLKNPANWNRAVPLTYEQFRFGFANAVSEDEAKELYETFAVPAPGRPLFQARPPTSTPGQGQGRRIPSEDCYHRVRRRITPYRGRSRTRPSKQNRTRVSPIVRCPTAATR